jgi:hypothetical protein
VLSISEELFAKHERAGSAVGDIVYLKETDRGELDGAWPPGPGLLASARVRADEDDRRPEKLERRPETSMDFCNTRYACFGNID